MMHRYCEAEYERKSSAKKKGTVIISAGTTNLEVMKQQGVEQPSLFEKQVLSRISLIAGDIPEDQILSCMPWKYLDSEQLSICAKAEKNLIAIEILKHIPQSVAHFEVKKSSNGYTVTAIASVVPEGAAQRKALERIVEITNADYESIKITNSSLLHVPVWNIIFSTLGNETFVTILILRMELPSMNLCVVRSSFIIQ